MTAPIRVRLKGTARIVHRCYRCGEVIEGEPVITYLEDGRPVAYHPEHKEPTQWPQTQD